MTWMDASLVTVAIVAACAIALLIGYLLLTLVTSLVRLVYPEVHEPTLEDTARALLAVVDNRNYDLPAWTIGTMICPHDEEWYYCDTCKHEYETTLANAIDNLRNSLPRKR